MKPLQPTGLQRRRNLSHYVFRTKGQTQSQLSKHEYVRLDLQTHEHVRGVNGERRFGDHRAANIHERVKKVAEHRRRTLQSDHKCVALELLISEVEQSYDTARNTCQWT